MGKSRAWEHFTVKTPCLAQCQLCSNVIATNHGSTSGLLRHLRLKHDISNAVSSPPMSSAAESSVTPEPQPGSSMDTGTDTKRKASTMETTTNRPHKQQKLNFPMKPIYDIRETLARLTAEDGFTFNGIAHSSYLRHAMARDGMKLPTNTSVIRDHVLSYQRTIDEKIKQELEDKILNGERFSGTTDEWTSIGGRRFMNINVHGRNSFVRNLGLVRISGAFTAPRAVETIDNHLSKYGIDTSKHMFAITADGAAVMKKCGDMSASEYQGCYSHALHLAVCDVLYSKRTGNGS